MGLQLQGFDRVRVSPPGFPRWLGSREQAVIHQRTIGHEPDQSIEFDQPVGWKGPELGPFPAVVLRVRSLRR